MILLLWEYSKSFNVDVVEFEWEVERTRNFSQPLYQGWRSSFWVPYLDTIYKISVNKLFIRHLKPGVFTMIGTSWPAWRLVAAGR
jgi:hypothetical protein